VKVAVRRASRPSRSTIDCAQDVKAPPATHPVVHVGSDTLVERQRIAVADGWWEIELRDGLLTRGAFVVPSDKPGGTESNVVASWSLDVDRRPVFDQPAHETRSASSDDARLTLERYVSRCAAGDWEAGIREMWLVDEAVFHTVGVNSLPQSGVDALLDEGLRWVAPRATAQHVEPEIVGVQSLGRLACVTLSGLSSRGAAYLLARVVPELPTEVVTASDVSAWAIVSVVCWDSPHGALGNNRGEREGYRPAGPTPDFRHIGAQANGTSDPRPHASGTTKRGAVERFGDWVSLPVVGFMVSLAVYAFTRLWRVEDFPIYFHGDEAFQVVAARRLVQGNFRNELGVPFPFYFSNGGTWAPLISTYLHVATSTLFGTSVQVARGTTALVSVIGGAGLALYARDSLGLRTWWVLPLLLANVPAWFLHSRTTFETAYCVSGYATFLWCYGRYRNGAPRWGALAVVAAAFTFYTYTNGQLIIGLTGALLTIVDARHHWAMRRHLGWVLAPALISLVPYVIYARAAPDATTDQLWRVSSYLVQDLPVGEKVRQFVLHYWAGMDPRYWFLPNPRELSRHAMLGHANMSTWLFPFVALGLAMAIIGIGRPGLRLLIISLAATPIGASLADVGITRVLPVIVPLTLLAHVGFDGTLVKVASIARRFALRGGSAWTRSLVGSVHFSTTGALLLWIGLSTQGGALMLEALDNGPKWFTDYGLYGQQWGAVQVFREIKSKARSRPDDTFLVTSTWANGTDIYLPFFTPELMDAGRVRMGNVRDLLSVRRELTPNMVWVMTADEVELARTSKRFRAINVESALTYPNGAPGFSFARLEYVSNVEEVVAAERAARVALRSGQIMVNGERLAVRHSFLDAGGLSDLFDANRRTLGRFNGGNPATLEWAFPAPRAVATVVLAMTAGNWHVSLAILRPDGVVETVEQDIDARVDPIVSIDVPPGTVGAIRLMITSRVHTDEAIIHLRDVTWQ